MPSRGLVIAIEDYPLSDGSLAAKIDGAADAGARFAEWLTGVKGIRPENIFVCSDGGSYPATAQRFGVERERILDAVMELVKQGQDTTEELFVFFSGHGFTFQDAPNRRAVAVLVAGDFATASDSGTKCLDLVEAQTKLWNILGGRNHYYFIDACRNVLNEGDIELIPFGRKLGRTAQRGLPDRFTLYSSKFGEPADIESPFAGALLDGLHGKGRAKGYTPAGDLFVSFPLLKKYVEARMEGRKIDETKDASGDGFILQIQPVPTYKCTIRVAGAGPTDEFEARLGVVGQPGFIDKQKFTGPLFELPYSPGDLTLNLYQNNTRLDRVAPPIGALLDFYDECTAVFRQPTGGLESATFEGPQTASFTAPPELTVRAMNLNTGGITMIEGGSTRSLHEGTWEFSVLERGSSIAKRVNDVVGGEDLSFDLPPAGADPVRGSIVSALPYNDPGRSVVEFSESLQGGIANPDLGLWLTLMAAAHIFNPGEFDKLQVLPLASFDGVKAGKSAIYVISALPHQDTVIAAVNGKWRQLDEVPGLDHVLHTSVAAQPGPGFISMRLEGGETRTLTSWNLANRVTLIVLSEDDSGRLTVSQFMLPVRRLLGELSASERVYFENNAVLQLVRTIYGFQRTFSRGRMLAPPDKLERQRYEALLRAEWIDPVMSLVVCYDAIRRGAQPLLDSVRNLLLPALRDHYLSIPDVSAIAEQLAAGSTSRPVTPPLFTEGLFAYPDWTDHLPYPARKLDYGSVWTTWIGAVKA